MSGRVITVLPFMYLRDSRDTTKVRIDWRAISLTVSMECILLGGDAARKGTEDNGMKRSMPLSPFHYCRTFRPPFLNIQSSPWEGIFLFVVF